MQAFTPSRLHVESRDAVTSTAPVRGRTYTMTHTDDTAELTVTIGLTPAYDKTNKLRDEVFLTFEQDGNDIKLYGSVLIDSNELQMNSKKRNEIFLREMPTALKAIRYADRSLFQKYPKLDDIPIYIWFQSDSKEYNRLYDFGTMKDYK